MTRNRSNATFMYQSSTAEVNGNLKNLTLCRRKAAPVAGVEKAPPSDNARRVHEPGDERPGFGTIRPIGAIARIEGASLIASRQVYREPLRSARAR